MKVVCTRTCAIRLGQLLTGRAGTFQVWHRHIHEATSARLELAAVRAGTLWHAGQPGPARSGAQLSAGRQASLADLVASPPGDLGGKLRACGNVQLGEDVREVGLDGPV